MRPDPARIRTGAADPSLTRHGGLLGLARFLRERGVDASLRARFAHLKQGRHVVYPMHGQLRLLLDAAFAGEDRVFGIEHLAADRLFTLLSGGALPSVDTLYDDLARFGEAEVASLEEMVADAGLSALRGRRLDVIHVDVDTTVEPLFGGQEGAKPGPNPRYRGRPSYHPVLAYCPEVNRVVGAQLRHGDTGFGDADVPRLRAWLKRVRDAVGDRCAIYVRVDAAGDCAALVDMLVANGVHFVIKARQTRDLRAAVSGIPASKWETSEVEEAGGRAVQQWAWVPFSRASWLQRDRMVRVVAVRTRDVRAGMQHALFEDLDFSTSVYLTNDWDNPGDEIQRNYDGRAGVEPVIGDLKHGLGIGKVPTSGFHANHAMLLVKLLAFNLLRAFAEQVAPAVARFRTDWLRRALVHVAGRVCRTAGRTWTVRLAPVTAAGP